MSMGIAIAIAVILLIVGFVAGYYIYPSVNKTSSTSSSASLSETGSSLFYPLMTRWAANYTGATISAAATGSGTGQSSAILNIVNMGASDGYLTNASTTNVANFAAAISAQYVFYHIPGLTTHLNLNGTILALIYNGTITTWNNPLIAAANPTVTLPSSAIVPIARSDSSGDTFLFSSYCAMNDKFWPFGVSTKALTTDPHATGADLNTGMVSAIEATSYAIGYVGISYEATAISDGLQYAALGDNLSMSATGGVNSSNYILPSPATIGDDANLALEHLNYATYGLAITLIQGGSWAGAVTINNGAGGTNPTSQYPTPYPIVNLEYLIIKLAPTGGTQVSSGNLAATVTFLHWAITTGNYAAGGGASAWINQVGFLPLTPEVAGYDLQILASVQT
jgi:phosphate transport system substrate-binding protein